MQVAKELIGILPLSPSFSFLILVINYSPGNMERFWVSVSLTSKGELGKKSILQTPAPSPETSSSRKQKS